MTTAWYGHLKYKHTPLVLAIFWVGWKGFVFMRTVPDGAMLVKAMARMWSWQFTYENGRSAGPP
jgi:cytochrome c oxidase subunit 2